MQPQVTRRPFLAKSRREPSARLDDRVSSIPVAGLAATRALALVHEREREDASRRSESEPGAVVLG
jgi:hypothetical protein